jgi:hypothetical protein
MDGRACRAAWSDVQRNSASRNDGLKKCGKPLAIVLRCHAEFLAIVDAWRERWRAPGRWGMFGFVHCPRLEYRRPWRGDQQNINECPRTPRPGPGRRWCGHFKGVSGGVLRGHRTK